MAARLGYVRISQDMQGHVEHGILGLSICQDIIILGHLRSGIQGLCKARICWDILEHLNPLYAKISIRELQLTAKFINVKKSRVKFSPRTYIKHS